MSTRDWDAELKKIDRQLASISDEALMPTPAPGDKVPGAKAPAKGVPAESPRAVTLGVLWRLGLAIAIGFGIVFWPYETHCGVGLLGYLGAIGVVIASGIWSARWTWRQRAARAHILSLLVALWGLVLGAREVLPRVGYATPSAEHPATWMCP